MQEVLSFSQPKKNEKRRQTQLLLVQMKMYPFVTSFQEEEKKGRKPLRFVMRQSELTGDEQAQAAGRGTNLRNIRYPVDTSLVLGVVFSTSEGV